jgi:2-C-methyl-D-erythritol 4-phosphate cytidylyltransferase
VRVEVVAGGAERGDSVSAGLAALPANVEVVLVHDAARCLTPVGVFQRVIAAVRGGAGAVVPGVAVVDTVKQVDESGWVLGTPDRAGLRAIQTPQGFRRDLLERAHAASSDATDDAGLVERLGERVLVVDGDPRALKITGPADLEAAGRILAG